MQDDNNQQAPAPDGGWSYTPETVPVSEQPANTPPTESITWTASQFVARHKGGTWFLGLIGFVVALCALIFVTIHDYISIGAVIIVGTLFGVVANSKPKSLSYTIDDSGITVNGKFYPYDLFKSFALMKDDALGYINLMPLKRFMPDISIYYAPNDEQHIFDALAGNLPNEQRPEHRVDSLMKRLRF